MLRAERPTYDGPALFSYGFRPFFLGAGLFALVVVPLWMAVFSGRVVLAGPFPPVDWHIHEMLFGYTSAVVAGFLFTAVPNWTGRMPKRGMPLVFLLVLWTLGRLAVAGAGGLPPLAVMAVDCAFLAAIAAMICAEIVAGRNWRNLKVVIPVLLYLSANVVFHLEVMRSGTSDVGRRLGFAVVIFLIMLIGGRIIPSFTRNWLSARGDGRLPRPFGRFDAVCLLAGGAAMLLWTALPFAAISGLALLAAAALHLLRLSRWQGVRTLRSPLLLMLHVAYGFIPLGLAALGAAVLSGGASQGAGLHLLGIGGVGGMTVAVMMRATMGHTGRALVAGPTMTLAFGLVVVAALIRGVLGTAAVAGISGATLAATLWVLAFGLVVARIGPWLALPKVAPRQPSRSS